ncbi:hypothetical protein HDU88_003986 [Geranomyces variabilis]|nr:hypothetical protein HDU88_003986 [Geranomyces variabilis]
MRKIFADLVQAKTDWSNVTVEGAMAAISVAPRASAVPIVEAPSAVQDPLADLFAYLERFVDSDGGPQGRPGYGRTDPSPESDLVRQAGATSQAADSLKCRQCDFTTARQKAMTEHIRLVHRIGLKTCRWCGKTMHLNNLKTHEEACSKNPEWQRYSCTICSKSYAQRQSLKRHLASTAHADKVRLTEQSAAMAAADQACDVNAKDEADAIYDACDLSAEDLEAIDSIYCISQLPWDLDRVDKIRG